MSFMEIIDFGISRWGSDRDQKWNGSFRTVYLIFEREIRLRCVGIFS